MSKIFILSGIAAIIMIVGVIWTGAMAWARIFDGAPYSSWEIAMPIGACAIIAVMLQVIAMLKLWKS